MFAGFEVAAQVFSCIGLLVLIAACFLAVFLNFMTQNSAHNRWLEITVFVGGKKRCHVLPLIQICWPQSCPFYEELELETRMGFKKGAGVWFEPFAFFSVITPINN